MLLSLLNDMKEEKPATFRNTSYQVNKHKKNTNARKLKGVSSWLGHHGASVRNTSYSCSQGR